MATKDRITCHVLDTTLGKPARGVRVKLELTPPPPPPPRVFESQTDEDGRIQVWLPYSSATSSGEVPVYTLEDVLGEKGSSRWTLRFDTATYFGGEDKTFFPEVTIVFTVQHGQRYHVPLLLAPFSYSTYRGS
ncbi:hydroxyisourate hydrolase [Diplogelasinospora grovesii]|uniref:5-hydroxyisourate hydrolase n=1 Tax=Diplogelasinospora grovesii TaxID=303347 RepID=A0AAN6NE48_9PEZI|nr:hydroxyisourate hydrolase [Diplogelasinospora grovesii]